MILHVESSMFNLNVSLHFKKLVACRPSRVYEKSCNNKLDLGSVVLLYFHLFTKFTDRIENAAAILLRRKSVLNAS